jgi:hypothetical protein
MSELQLVFLSVIRLEQELVESTQLPKVGKSENLFKRDRRERTNPKTINELQKDIRKQSKKQLPVGSVVGLPDGN